MRILIGLALLAAFAVAVHPFAGSVKSASATAVCPANPSPPDPADPSMIVNQPTNGATVTSPVTISGQARVFEATVSIVIFDASGTPVIEAFTTAAEAGPTLAPFSTNVGFSVTSPQPGCIRVFEASAQDGSPRNVVQVEVTFAPPTTPPRTGSAGLQDDSSGGSHLWLYIAGGLALLGATGLAVKRNLWD
jgi:hypothetical protein